MIDQNAIDEVRARTDIVDVISNVVHLEKKGSGYMGLCPFHNEKTPSFHVDPGRQIFHCFGCGEGGNVFTILQKYDNLTFPEAVEQLAERAGIVLPEKKGDQRNVARERDKRERLLLQNRIAAVTYYRMLRSPAGERGLRYFRDRGLSDETMHRFGLGFAPVKSGGLIGELKKEGFDDRDIIDSGLAAFDEKNGLKEKFWNRVMFPIMDFNGKVIGFGGRVLGDGMPKYLNSPETLIFDKSRNLYGIHLARKSRKGRIILCEGYMDVIAMHQAGFSEACASLGTAFTNGQANILKRYTEDVILSYDSDTAGVKAALRALSILRDAGLNGKVLNLSPYKDPDEFIRAEGADKFEQRLLDAENPFFFELRQMESGYQLRDAAERTRFQHEIARLLAASFEDPIERENYLKDAAALYDVNAKDLRERVARIAEKGVKRPPANDGAVTIRRREREGEDKTLRAQRMLLTWISKDPGLAKRVNAYLAPADFSDALYARIAAYLFEEPDKEISEWIGGFEEEEIRRASAALNEPMPEIEKETEREKALHDLIYDVMRSGMEKRLLEMEASDGNYLRETIEGRKRLERFAKLKTI